MNIINQLNAPPQTTALQKVFILIGLGVFVALAALTASLPLPILSNQPDSIPVAGPTTTNNAYTIDAGATAWMIVAAFFGILLTPAVSYLYGNSLLLYFSSFPSLSSICSQFIWSLNFFLCSSFITCWVYDCCALDRFYLFLDLCQDC
jgi:hypothetical protein